MTLHCTYMESPVGRLRLIASPRALVAVLWEGESADGLTAQGRNPDRPYPILAEAERQLREYFAGARARFDLPLEPRGTVFQQRVWRSLRKIPFGRTRSYVEIARAIGSPRACRAVGGASSRNPIPIVIPCHRVIGADGSLTGFAGGLDRKARLLAFERSLADHGGTPSALRARSFAAK